MEVKKSDTVRVHYTGRLTYGTIFDSSIGRGEHATVVTVTKSVQKT